MRKGRPHWRHNALRRERHAPGEEAFLCNHLFAGDEVVVWRKL
jgi:hypothetical protein